VQLGAQSGELVAIERGLAKGDLFVAHPDPAFTDGAIVE
jgi:hypothetical protein